MTSNVHDDSAVVGKQRLLQHADYSIAILCPMGIELAPVEALLDEAHSHLRTIRDYNVYSLGKIGPHNIVITVSPETGINSAAIVANQLTNDFPSIRCGFIVGVGGGLPSHSSDIRLGDVVVSRPRDIAGGVVQYDRGKLLAGSHFRRTGTLNKPPAVITSSIERLKARHEREGNQILQTLSKMIEEWQNMSPRYNHPGTRLDLLFDPTYVHKGGTDCLSCDKSFIIARRERQSLDPIIHYGTIGSANVVLKDGIDRDILSKNLDILCVEMEAAGVLDVMPCVVVRGICDYADSHKNDVWQPYAAATAAAYLRELILTIPPIGTNNPLLTAWKPNYEYILGHDHSAETPRRQTFSEDDRTAIGSLSQPDLTMSQASRSQGRNYTPPDFGKACDGSSQQSSLSEEGISKKRRFCESTVSDNHVYERPPKPCKSQFDENPVQDVQDSTELWQCIVDTLKFDQMDSRHATIRQALAKTCDWFLERSEYKSWTDEQQRDHHNGFLWIKGKPAAGKSTLVKYLLAHTEKTRPYDTVIFFFFHARGEDLEKTIEGMYRSLLVQLFEKLPALRQAFEKAGIHRVPQRWTIDILQNLFAACIKCLDRQPLICFIDALDECAEDEVRDMVDFLEEVASAAMSCGIRLSICFSSRHYPTITIEKGQQLVLEDQDGHLQDLSAYLAGKLKRGRSQKMANIKQKILARASGVFLWVVLVVKLLNKEYDAGRSHMLEQKLDEIPDGLQDLFKDILTRDHTNTDALVLCLQWVLHAKRPLACEELYFAILSGTDLQDIHPEDADEMVRFILDASKGLVEKTKGYKPRIQFIHESVREFLSNDNGLRQVRPDVSEDLNGQCHERLKQCCQTYWSLNSTTIASLIEQLTASNSMNMKFVRESVVLKFPFIEYATQYILKHADAAVAEGADQSPFLSEFQLHEWKNVFNHVKKSNVARIQNVNTLLDLALEQDHFELLRLMNKKRAYFGITVNDLQTFLIGAIKRNK